MQGLRDVGDSIVLMGKNTMMKRSIRLYCERTGDETWLGLTEILVGNVGLIFTKGDLAEAGCPLLPAFSAQGNLPATSACTVPPAGVTAHSTHQARQQPSVQLQPLCLLPPLRMHANV